MSFYTCLLDIVVRIKEASHGSHQDSATQRLCL